MSHHESICPPPYNAAAEPSLVTQTFERLGRMSLREIRRRYQIALSQDDLPSVLVYAREIDFRNARAGRPWLKRGQR